MTSLEKGMREFAQFAAKLKGDEKSEAQTFLFHLLAAFGHDANTLPEGSAFECRVRFPGQRTKFADFVWPGRVLIEMKSRGGKLAQCCGSSCRRRPRRFSVSVPVSVLTLTLLGPHRQFTATNGWSLRDLYRRLESPGTNRLRDAQAALDSAVRAAYGMKATEAPLAFLLRLNLELADGERGLCAGAHVPPVPPPDPEARPAGECARSTTIILHYQRQLKFTVTPV